jgi:twinkle protein
MDARDIASRMASQAEMVAIHLLPSGRKVGHEWKAGFIRGESGQSLGVHLTGKKAGLWADFSTGESGDLLDLWSKVKNVPLKTALQEAREYLGFSNIVLQTPPKARQWTKPTDSVKAIQPGSNIHKYLTETRKLSIEALQAYKLCEGEHYGPAVVFPYYREGQLVQTKHLSLSRPEGKKQIKTSKETMPCLFGWQAIPDNAREIVICEGEIDAVSFWMMGKPALSVPYGAGGGNKQQWIDLEWDNLAQFDTIYLAFDQDEAGQACIPEIMQRLGLNRCRVLDIPAKDVNEWLCIGFTTAEVELVFKTASSTDPQELKPVSDFLEATLQTFTPSAEQKGLALPWAKTNEQIRLRSGELSIWTGINGHGKSQLLGHVMAQAMHLDHRICIFSGEIKPARLLNRLCRQLTAMRDPSEGYLRAAFDWMHDKLWLFDVTGTTKTARILEVFEYAAKRYGIRHFVVDSLMKCGIAEDDYKAQKQFVEALADFKNQYDAHVDLVAHSRKAENEKQIVSKLDVKGTGAITDLADNCFTVWRNKGKEDELQKTPDDLKLKSKFDAILTCDKQRNGEWEGVVMLWYDRDSFQYLSGPDYKPFRYVNWSQEHVKESNPSKIAFKASVFENT